MQDLVTTYKDRLLAGKYRLMERIASGGMGDVYLAECDETKEPRAIKIIREQLLDSEINRKRFLREIKLTHMLGKTNPHIVFIYDDYGFDGDLGFYAMEYLEGSSLAERIFQQPGELPISWCLNVTVEICEAMEAVHKAGVIHRDLKPSNIFLTKTKERDDFVKVVDFGIAKQLAMGTVLTEPGSFAGTIYYIAPEHLGMPIEGQMPKGEPDSRTDIYSLGCILYEMLTGYPPFRPKQRHTQKAVAFAEVLQQHLTEAPAKPSQFRPDIPTSLEVILELALQKQPHKRLQRMSDFADALRRVPAVEAVMKRHAGPSERSPKTDNAPPLPETDPNPPPLSGKKNLTEKTLADQDLMDTTENELSRAAFAAQKPLPKKKG